MHVAEAADVHENVEAQGGSGMEGAQCFVVAAAVARTQLDDFRDAGGGKLANKIANLAVGVVGGGVEQRGREFDFEGLSAFDQVDERRGGDGLASQEFGGSLGQFRLCSL
jgi:hypothetical protein